MTKPFLKYCGNKSQEDFQISLASNADYIGFVFAESKRQVIVEEVAKWVKGVELGDKKMVGVFVNQSFEEIKDAVEKIPLTVVQCHGDESPEFIKKLKTEIDADVWKVIHHEDGAASMRMKPYQGLVDGYVIDKKIGAVYGGTGQSFDWSFLPSYLRQANVEGVLCFIAGGINGGSIAQLLTYLPSGIDISSGIEEDFKKCKEKINHIEGKVMGIDTNTR